MGKVVTPSDVAGAFMVRYAQYQSGTLNEPVLSNDMVMAILHTIKLDPSSMLRFFVQANFTVKLALEEKYGDNSESVIAGLLEWHSVTCGFFIPYLHRFMESTANLVAERDLYEMYGNDTVLPVPQVDPSEVFKNLEGFGLKEWITPEDDAEQPLP
jgi:hypothetical protein